MNDIISKIKNLYNSLSPEGKQHFLWPLVISFFTFLLTSAFWKYSDYSNKNYLLQEKKLTIISDLSESYQSYYYYSTFRGMLDLEQIEYANQKTEEDHSSQKLELSIKQKLILADLMKAKYPIAYEKMMEGDTKAPIFLKNLQLAQFFFNDQIRVKANEFMDYTPLDNKITELIQKKIQENKTTITEKDKNEILQNIQTEMNSKFSELINEMIKEVK